MERLNTKKLVLTVLGSIAAVIVLLIVFFLIMLHGMFNGFEGIKTATSSQVQVLNRAEWVKPQAAGYNRIGFSPAAVSNNWKRHTDTIYMGATYDMTRNPSEEGFKKYVQLLIDDGYKVESQKGRKIELSKENISVTVENDLLGQDNLLEVGVSAEL